jgi:hypothetical protein
MHALRMPSRELTLAAAIFLLSPAIWAQATDPAVQQLLQRIDRLEKRVSELEAARPAQFPQGVERTPAPAVAAPAPAAGHDHGTPVEPPTTFPSLKLSGFGDINFSSSDQKGARSGFNEGQFILHLSSALSPRVTYFGELSMTARTDAGSGSPPATGFNVEVERNIIRFDQSDHLKCSFGRYHTPISYWNTAFHHGSWLQTTASRPEMVQFGGSFIPVHFVGTLAEGAYNAGGLNLNYNVGVGNGRSSVLSRSGDWGDVNNNKAWLTTVFIKPDRFYGLQVGASAYRDKITATGRPETREWIESAHVVWSKENPEFIAEFFNVTHQQPGSNVKVNSQAWYAQVAYRLPVADHWKPYYRYEYIHVPLADAVYRGLVTNLSGSTVGVRYDISNFAAFKFEYRNQGRPGLTNINSAWVQTSFTF